MTNIPVRAIVFFLSYVSLQEIHNRDRVLNMRVFLIQHSRFNASTMFHTVHATSTVCTGFRGKKIKNLRLIEVLKQKGQPADLFPIVKILHLNLETMPALAVNSHTSESKVLLSLVTIQPHNITATPW